MVRQRVPLRGSAWQFLGACVMGACLRPCAALFRTPDNFAGLRANPIVDRSTWFRFCRYGKRSACHLRLEISLDVAVLSTCFFGF